MSLSNAERIALLISCHRCEYATQVLLTRLIENDEVICMYCGKLIEIGGDDRTRIKELASLCRRLDADAAFVTRRRK